MIDEGLGFSLMPFLAMQTPQHESMNIRPIKTNRDEAA
jgi:hypothetical protein